MELLRQRIRIEQRGSSNGVFCEKGCTQGPGGSAKEVSPKHGAVSFPDTIRQCRQKKKLLKCAGF
jgi:hypothetical protein